MPVTMTSHPKLLFVDWQVDVEEATARGGSHAGSKCGRSMAAGRRELNREENESPYFAFPALVGAPAYGLRPPGGSQAQRHLTEDDLPLEQFRTEEDRQLAERLAEASARSATEAARSGQSAGQRNTSGLSLSGVVRRLTGRDSS
jgi:hypothetical protein